MKPNNKKIFISIASYRDPELIPTIQDCLAKARNPNNLYFGIFAQRDETETVDQLYGNHPNFRIDGCDWKDSKGACWARHLIQKKLFRDEGYYLQLDSHHRFIQDWDEYLIYLMGIAESNKPIIGTYGTTYWPDRPEEDLKNEPYKISAFDTFTEDGDIISRPIYMSNHKNMGAELVTASLLSGHFIFTYGHFCREVMYDPNFYFRGEEITLSARAYTHGYDMFHPTKTIIWHEYLRVQRNKHWNDHTKNNGFSLEAEDRNIRSKERQRKLLMMEPCNIDFRHYGLGRQRSLHDYELWAGLDFKKRRVHKYCADYRGNSPHPYRMTEQEWEAGMLETYTYDIEWPYEKIPDNTDFDFWFFGFEKSTGELLYRKDFSHDDTFFHQYFQKHNNKYRARFGAEQKPDQCVIIPHIRNADWAEKIIIPV